MELETVTSNVVDNVVKKLLVTTDISVDLPKQKKIRTKKMVTCDCGVEVSTCQKSRHLKSAKHQDSHQILLKAIVSKVDSIMDSLKAGIHVKYTTPTDISTIWPNSGK